jgi:DNA polymerase alpha subunit B
VLVINPGVFMRPNGPVSYVSLSLKAPNYEKLTKVQGQNEELYLHDIWDRAKIDIIKS